MLRVSKRWARDESAAIGGSRFNWLGVNWLGVNWLGVNWLGVNWLGVNWLGVNWLGVNARFCRERPAGVPLGGDPHHRCKLR